MKSLFVARKSFYISTTSRNVIFFKKKQLKPFFNLVIFFFFNCFSFVFFLCNFPAPAANFFKYLQFCSRKLYAMSQRNSHFDVLQQSALSSHVYFMELSSRLIENNNS